MCSVVGYVGKTYSKSFVVEGLKRLEYRGYDSTGFACLNPQDSRLMYAKAEGGVINLVHKLETSPIDGFLGIGHTRWSTHGVSSEANAHPHFDCQKSIALVHNGIIENYYELKKMLEASGHIFHSQTDTETVAHFLEMLLTTHKTIKSAIVDWVKNLEGAYAIVALLQDYPDQMIVVRKRSPLCIGIGDSEMFVASDLLAFAQKTNKVLFLPDESFALLSHDRIQLFDFEGNPLPLQVQEVNFDWDVLEKDGHDHYMLKEIFEQKNAITQTVNFLASVSDNIWEHLGLSVDTVKKLEKINMVACGTSWHAASIAQFFFEEIALIPAQAHLASEFRYKSFFKEENSLCIPISQSGETADTIEGLRLINEMNIPSVALTNVASSTMVRESGGFLLTQAGREIAVASTKAFSTQVAALYWFAHRIALEKGIITQKQMFAAQEDILVAAEVLQNTIENYRFDIMRSIAKEYAQYDKAIFLGRHVSYPFALEAALKLKEITYIFAQSYPAGEIKHGPLALVDENTPVFVFSHADPILYQKLLSNVQEVKSRNGHIVAFAFAGQHELCDLAHRSFVIPNIKPLLGPLAMTGIMQFFAYAIAKELNCPIDKPRNLAKTVTVE
jgi:glucosamine--fructose-6-phosphate aminotransferase (isomerizing)